MKLVPYHYRTEGETVGYMFWCPGCKSIHAYAITNYKNNPVWTFNGNMEAPTFAPSLLYEGRSAGAAGHRCHLFLTDGKIQFCPDSTHELAGKTVDLPEYPENR